MTVLPLEKVQEHQGVRLVYDKLMSTYKDGRGVHAETILNAVGALAGFAAQQAVWKVLIEPERRNPGDYLVMVQTKSDERFYFGESINLVLTYDQGKRLSFWYFVLGAVGNADPESLDLTDIFRNTAATVGSELFALPRLPDKHLPHELPRKALQRQWQHIQPLLEKAGGSPIQWPALLGVVASILIRQTASVLEPATAARILMESAIPMSKVNPQTVPGSTSGIRPIDKWSGRASEETAAETIFKEVRKVLPTAMTS
ncbi:MAG TPA: hypothetical protein V6D22_19365 [Candidatus Obscuribacterales bacterium]